MTEIRSDFLSLNAEDKKLVLAQFLSELTVAVRVYLYVDGQNETINVEKLKTINQLLHLTSGKVRDMLLETSRQYPDDVFINIIVETGELGFVQELEWLWERSMRILHVAERT